MTRRSVTHRSFSERGQSLVLITVFMMSLLGMAAMAIDAGSWYQDRRHLQDDADAAALAGAAYIPAGSQSSSATTNFNKNKMTGETATVTTPTYDSVTVSVTYPATSYFARLFGITSATITATATAKIQASGSVAHHVSPYAVLRSVYNNGTGTSLFTCSGSGVTSNCGTVDLPTASNTTGGSCTGSVYTGTSQNVSDALSDLIDIGTLNVGGCLSPKPGAAQGSATVADGLLGTFAQDMHSLGNGTYEVVHQSYDDGQGLPPRLIYVPIVDQFTQGTTGPWTITGFAWFYMTGSIGSGSNRTIAGQFVTIAGPPLGGNSVSWVAGQIGQVTSVSLTA
jgi:Flp pilus assembly protein TadG